MNFSITTKSPETLSNYVVVGMFEGQKLTSAANTINKVSKGTLLQNLKSRKFSGTAGQTLELTNLPGTNAKTVLVIGLGSNKCKVEFIKAIENVFSKVREAGETTITLFIPELKASGVDRAWMTRQIASIGTSRSYRYEQRNTLLDGKSFSGTPAKVA
ncbi:MAG: M17 family peptidase N-terminal domain-containing protein, partial [Burkholderiales bacterium]|nr:M17 family peptidase N-terminal domain-containing protein [Burkholderiales bacterium]